MCGWGLGPAWLKGVSEGVSDIGPSLRALVGGVGAGLGLYMLGGRPRGQRIKPESPTGSPLPKGTGEALAVFPSIPLLPPPQALPQVLPHCRWTPNRGWVLLGVGTPPLPHPPLRGVGPVGLVFTFVPSSLSLTPSGPVWLEGASVGKGSGSGSQQAPGGPGGQGKPGHAPF